MVKKNNTAAVKALAKRILARTIEAYPQLHIDPSKKPSKKAQECADIISGKVPNLGDGLGRYTKRITALVSVIIGEDISHLVGQPVALKPVSYTVIVPTELSIKEVNTKFDPKKGYLVTEQTAGQGDFYYMNSASGDPMGSNRPGNLPKYLQLPTLQQVEEVVAGNMKAFELFLL